MLQIFSLVKMSLIFTAIIALVSRVQSDETDFGYIFNRDRKEWDLKTYQLFVKTSKITKYCLFSMIAQ